MKAKKIVTGLISLSAVLFLVAGCGKGNDKDAASANSSTAASTTESSVSSEPEVDLNSLELPQLNPEVADNEALVEMVTNEGSIKFKLFPEQAPKAVENFLTHAKDGYYDGVVFHRIMKDFMIQSGDPDGDGTGGGSIWDEEFVPEISNQLYHINGALAMARTGQPVDQPSQGSQFYIVQNEEDQSATLNQLADPKNGGIKFPDKIAEEYKKGGVPFLDTQYSVFGQVIDGMDTVNKIANTEVKVGASGEASTPTKEIKIEKINVLQEPK